VRPGALSLSGATLTRMAGGRSRDSDHGTLADRLARTRANTERETARAEGVTHPHEGPTPPPVKHCWYVGPDGRQAALLLDWRKVSEHSAWEGYIAVARPVDDGWGLVTIWVGAGMLEQA